MSESNPHLHWMIFLAQLPANPSGLRVTVWRRLKMQGASNLQNGVWLLPQNSQNKIFLERLLGYIKENNATGQIFVVQALHKSIEEDIINEFKADRDQEYAELLEHSLNFISEIEREIQEKKFTFAELEESEQNFKRLQKWLLKIQKRDYFTGEKSDEAKKTIDSCHTKLKNYTTLLYELEGIGTHEDTEVTDNLTSLSDNREQDDGTFE